MDTRPPSQRVREAIASGDADLVEAEVQRWEASVRSLQVYSVEWITSLLSFVGRELGDDGVERSLRAFGDDYVLPRRGAPGDWEVLPAAVRAAVIARAMLANGGTVDVTEDEDGLRLAFRCGSGGRLIDEGRYDVDGGPYLTLAGPSPLTAGLALLPVYCSHCPVHNELLELERGGVPTSVETPSPGPVGSASTSSLTTPGRWIRSCGPGSDWSRLMSELLARVPGVPEAVHGVDGKVVVVTGAGQGIGLGVARHLSGLGARVVIAERSQRRGLAAQEMLGDSGFYVHTDVGDQASCSAAIGAAVEHFGRLDGLVCNAQSFRPTTLLAEVPVEDVETFWRTGPQGTLWLMQAAHPVMAAQGWGRIVTFGSSTGVTGMPGYGAYAASKEAIRGLTRTAAREWGRDGITVNCVCPGAASPRGLEAAAREEPAHVEHMKTHPIGRMGDPEHDVAPVVAFLLSDASRWLTGQTLMVDGGGTLRA